MKSIVKALKKNFPDKAVSLLKQHDKSLLAKDLKKLVEYAVDHGYYSIIKFLWEVSIHRYDIPAVGRYRLLENAIKNGYTDEVSLILNDRENFPLIIDLIFVSKLAINHNRIEVLKLLLSDPNFDPSADNNISIILTSEAGLVGMVKLLLADKRVDPSARSSEALGAASSNGHTEVVKLLLSDERVDPSADDNYAIRYASENGRIEVVKLLLSDERVDPSADNNSGIIWTSRKGHTEVVKILLSDERVNPSADDNRAIKWASERGHTEVVKLLEEAGCNL